MRNQPEILAWRILLGSFTIFLLVCGAIAFGAQWFLLQSTQNMRIELSTARGTISVTGPNVEEAIAVADARSDISVGSTIRTDSSSQAVLTFYDANHENPTATLVVFNDSDMSIVLARAPRFGLNRKPAQIQLTSNGGTTDVLILEQTRPVDVEVVSSQAFIRISETGSYSITVSDESTSLDVFTGNALMVDSETGLNAEVNENEHASTENGGGPVEVVDAPIQLLENPTFDEGYDTGWNFYNDREPPGTVQNVLIDSRPAIMIDRSQTHWPDLTLGHGETGLVQFIDEDVSDYSYLAIRMTFYVDEQSLSTCGIQGSECPLMIQLKYIDPDGSEQRFIHGFYATHNPSLEYPLTCDSCRSDHDRVNLKSWFTYESGNLITQAPTQRPVQIIELSLYASGHAYRAYVSEIALLAGQ